MNIYLRISSTTIFMSVFGCSTITSNIDANNLSLDRIEPPMELRAATVLYEYINDNDANELIVQFIADEVNYCNKFNSFVTIPEDRKNCDEEVEELKIFLSDDDWWRYHLSYKALSEVFIELKNQKLIYQDTNHTDYETIFEFTPHAYEHNIVQYYSVVCPAENRKEYAAICTLILNQAFYADTPAEYFNIEKMSDINTALWAYTAHKGIKVVPDNEWIADLVGRKQRVRTIMIDKQIVKFLYHGGGCYHQIWYEIIGDNEQLKFLKAENAFCI